MTTIIRGVKRTVRQNQQGPRGVAGLNWINAGWSVGLVAAEHDALLHNGTSYRCTAAHTAAAGTEPGIGASWATVWEVVASKGDTAVVTPESMTLATYNANNGATWTVSGPKVFASDPAERDAVTLERFSWYTALGIPEDNLIWNEAGVPDGLAALYTGVNGTICIAHRGGSMMFPELTAEGMTAVNNAGVLGIEIDVQLLSDSIPALMHDTTVDRTTTSSGNVSSFDTAGFKALAIDANTWHGSNFGNALSPPLLSETLGAFKGKAVLFIEAKSYGSGAAITAALQSAAIPASQAVVMSFSLDELSSAIVAGYPAMILGTGSEDYTAAWDAGVRWAGITSGDPAIVALWKAKGFSLLFWTATRRWVRDYYLSRGYDGTIVDEPIYLKSNTAFSTQDNFSAQTWQPGMIASDDGFTAGTRGRFVAPDFWGWETHTGTPPAAFVLQGWACPIKNDANCNDYTINFVIKYVGFIGANTSWGSIFITNNDRAFADSDTPHSASLVGYHILMRQNGAIDVYKRTDVSTFLLTTATPAGAVISNGQEVSFRLTVSPSAIRISRMEGEVEVAFANTTDTSYRGGYFHFGQRFMRCLFKDVVIS